MHGADGVAARCAGPTAGPSPPVLPGPVLTKTLVALQYAVMANASDFADEAVELPLADGGAVLVRHSGLNQVVVAFKVRRGDSLIVVFVGVGMGVGGGVWMGKWKGHRLGGRG